MNDSMADRLEEAGIRLTYDDLRICAALSREAEDLKEQTERLRSALEGGVARIGVAQGKKRGARTLDGMTEMIAALLELEEMYADKFSKYARHVKNVEHALDMVASPDQRRIVRMRYIEGLTWDKISRKLIMDERWCRRLANKAIKSLDIHE